MMEHIKKQNWIKKSINIFQVGLIKILKSYQIGIKLRIRRDCRSESWIIDQSHEKIQ